jgi:hypothetical protein
MCGCRRSIGIPNAPGDRAVAQKRHTWRPRVVSLGADHLRADGSCSPLRHDLDDLRALRESGCAPPDEVRSQVQCLLCPAHPGRYALRGHLHGLRSGPPGNARTGCESNHHNRPPSLSRGQACNHRKNPRTRYWDALEAHGCHTHSRLRRSVGRPGRHSRPDDRVGPSLSGLA